MNPHAQQKAEARKEIARLADAIRGVSVVPARVLNGSHQEAVAWKNRCASAKSNHFVHNVPGESNSLADLLDIRDKLQSLYQSII